MVLFVLAEYQKFSHFIVQFVFVPNVMDKLLFVVFLNLEWYLFSSFSILSFVAASYVLLVYVVYTP